MRHFAEEGQRCLVEWNPGNCYRGGTWDDALGRHLLARGFSPGGFRCVWAGGTGAVSDGATSEVEVEVRGYGPGELDGFLHELARMHGHDEAKRAETRLNVLHGEGDDRWRHYVGRIEGVPCCDATAFFGDGVAYLEWGGTLQAYRNRGCHAALIRRRLSDARENGCDLAFAVTDVGVPSARNLQRAGLRLAYNYVMLSREPSPLA